ncbi:MAG: hypothetical protein COA36_04755 [Desulfotalea sp.]|nr:MAG: hypothetical protein COA36_04755 [Desulfotalea sp.]
MGSDRKIILKTCAFWSVDLKKCQVCKGGLFIPLDEHITSYCTSNDHHYCLQYCLHARKTKQTDQDKQPSTNRRKSQRVEISKQVQLLKTIKSGKIINQISANAKTLDVSNVGMRLQTNVPLVNDTVIQFSFDDTFPVTLKTGAGLVEWCNKQIDSPGYQVGISFQSNWIIDAMHVFLKSHPTPVCL